VDCSLPAIAERASASERGVRILCDYLVTLGFLTKPNGSYGLAPDAALFLDRSSPASLATTARHLAHDSMIASFRDMAALVRAGGASGSGTLAPDDPLWVEFARWMAPLFRSQAEMMAPLLTESGRAATVLDVAAGHGLFGIAVARHNPAAQIVAVDWAPVLEVARANAEEFGVADRYRTIPGSVFDVDLGTGYDVVLLPNFLHHFDAPTNVALLRKLRAAMTDGGLIATVEFVPNDDRVTPPVAATFSLTMLGTTPAGDAYTFSEIDRMFRDAGFGDSRQLPLPGTPQRLILTRYGA
jgi:2-polyprenyl-3-methyl-5-hydroxy-6-metoxy-1,4-benzoquinol methylase